MSDDQQSFFSRWSQRKAKARTEPVPAEPPVAPARPPEAVASVPAPRTGAPEPAAPVIAPPRPPAPTLADVAELTQASDYSRFVAPGVDSNVRNAAMKKLFTDPHFNIMDGLDIYIDDYGKADPIPPEMLRQMVQSKVLGLFDDEEKTEAQQASEAIPVTVDADGDATPEAAGAEAATAKGAIGEQLTAEAPPGGSIRPPDAGDAAGCLPQSGFIAAAPFKGAADNSPHDDNAPLQLQPDDAAGRAGADQGARPGQV